MGRALGVFFILIFACLSAAASPKIDWRVKHPFRFFTDTADFDMQREALADVIGANNGTLPANAISALERTINDPGWLRLWYEQNAALYPDRRLWQPERGWAHQIQMRRATCWNAREQRYRGCKSDVFGDRRDTDYVLPRSHAVQLSILEPPTEQCRWEADVAVFVVGNTLSKNVDRPCSETIEARIPFVLNAVSGTQVRVEYSTASMLSTDIKVTDRLIVGIGDSYSSGEGNPDTPVQLMRVEKRYTRNYNFPYDASAKALKVEPADSLAVRRNGEPAFWLDRQCHRSAYSYHLRTALQVALAEPKHSAVTFVGFACSGAEITEGFLTDYAGVEVVGKEAFTTGGWARHKLPQVDRLMLELCKDNLSTTRPVRCPVGHFLRPVDMMIISIGGNDVGFVPLITDVLTKERPKYANKNTRWNANQNLNSFVRTMARLLKAHGIEEAKARAERLPARFSALREALRTLPIKSADAGKPNIILTAFPILENNEKGEICGTGDPRELMEGYNVGGVLALEPRALLGASKFANEVLNTKLADAADAGHWYFVSSHRDKFKDRGLCAQRPGHETDPTESLMLPYWKSPSWHNYDPRSQTRAYAPRQRLFRTLNDACLFVQFKRSGAPRNPSYWGPLDVIESCLGGPFHPTAEGHAVIADAVYGKVKTLLRLPEPTIESLR